MAEDAKTLAVKVADLESQKTALTKLVVAATARAAALEHAAPKSAALMEGIVKAAARPRAHSNDLGFDDGVGLVSLDMFVESLRRSQPSLFRSSSDEPAAPERKRAPAHEGPNPYRPSTFNLTEQFRLEKVKPEVAAALKRAAETEEWRK